MKIRGGTAPESVLHDIVRKVLDEVKGVVSVGGGATEKKTEK